jgi:hypothetical protein
MTRPPVAGSRVALCLISSEGTALAKEALSPKKLQAAGVVSGKVLPLIKLYNTRHHISIIFKTLEELGELSFHKKLHIVSYKPIVFLDIIFITIVTMRT